MASVVVIDAQKKASAEALQKVFVFCGAIASMEQHDAPSFRYTRIAFVNANDAKNAVLLTGTMIEDTTIQVVSETDFVLPDGDVPPTSTQAPSYDPFIDPYTNDAAPNTDTKPSITESISRAASETFIKLQVGFSNAMSDVRQSTLWTKLTPDPLPPVFQTQQPIQHSEFRPRRFDTAQPLPGTGPARAAAKPLPPPPPPKPTTTTAQPTGGTSIVPLSAPQPFVGLDDGQASHPRPEHPSLDTTPSDDTAIVI